MKSMVRLCSTMLFDIEEQTGISTSRDLIRLRHRVEKEGVSFLTITLPQFEKDVISSIDKGRIDPTSFTGFRRRGGVPEFLGGLLSTLFDERGLLRLHVVPEDWGYQASIIRFIRAICLLHSKVELKTTRNREQAALNNFVATDPDRKSVV